MSSTKTKKDSKSSTESLSLEAQRAAFTGRRFLAMPLAGLICWTIVGIGSHFLSLYLSAMLLFAATGSIVYLAMLISRFTGETFFHKDKNPFDRLFFHGLVQAVLVYSIAIPFFLVDYNSLPLTVGILTGLMWIPFSWIIQHWVGIFHSFVRTLLIVTVWYLFPQHSFIAIPIVVVGIYIVTIVVMEKRWQQLQASAN